MCTPEALPSRSRPARLLTLSLALLSRVGTCQSTVRPGDPPHVGARNVYEYRHFQALDRDYIQWVADNIHEVPYDVHESFIRHDWDRLEQAARTRSAEIVMVTQSSVARLPQLVLAAREWGGPVSVALLVEHTQGSEDAVECQRAISRFLQDTLIGPPSPTPMTTRRSIAPPITVSLLYGRAPAVVPCTTALQRALEGNRRNAEKTLQFANDLRARDPEQQRTQQSQQSAHGVPAQNGPASLQTPGVRAQQQLQGLTGQQVTTHIQATWHAQGTVRDVPTRTELVDGYRQTPRALLETTPGAAHQAEALQLRGADHTVDSLQGDTWGDVQSRGMRNTVQMRGGVDTVQMQRSTGAESREQAWRGGQGGQEVQMVDQEELPALWAYIPRPNSPQSAPQRTRRPWNETYADYYPVNALRNLAWRQVPSGVFVFLNDVDFVPTQQMHQDLVAGQWKVLLESMRDAWEQRRERRALVLPAFERLTTESDVPGQALATPFSGDCLVSEGCKVVYGAAVPRSFQMLRRMIRDKIVDVFHRQIFPEGHSCYSSFTWLQNEIPSRLVEMDYRHPCEPYVVAMSDALPRYDERFRGRGQNKVEQLTHMAMLGFKWALLPGHFVLHMPHSHTHEREQVWDSITTPLALMRVKVREVEHDPEFKRHIQLEVPLAVQPLLWEKWKARAAHTRDNAGQNAGQNARGA